MAKVRIGYGTDFVVENELVGIKTDTPKVNSLDVHGNITSDNLYSVGISTFKSIESFTSDKIIIGNQTLDTNTESGSISDEIIIEGEVTVSAGTTLTTSQESLTVTDNFTLPGITTDTPTAGTTRFNEILGSLEFYTGVEWKAVNSVVDNGGSGRGLFCGGYAPTTQDISFVNVSTEGNAVAFGELVHPMQYGGGCSDGTRGLFGGGRGPAPAYTKTNVIQYLTIASTGNTIDFGDLTNARRRVDATSSSTRGLWGPADGEPTNVNIIDYVEIQTLGNAVDFGDSLDVSGSYSRAALSSSTRAIFFGGADNYPALIDIEFVTIASKGNGVKFGEMTEERSNCAGGGFSNGVRGVIAGGYGISPVHQLSTVIDQITIASEGNAIDFGTLEFRTRDYNGCQNMVRGLIGGGRNPGTTQNVISKISLTTSGKSEDFGDLSKPAKANVGLSGSHGGLGGF